MVGGAYLVSLRVTQGALRRNLRSFAFDLSGAGRQTKTARTVLRSSVRSFSDSAHGALRGSLRGAVRGVAGTLDQYAA